MNQLPPTKMPALNVIVENRPLNIPHSIVAPSVLFDELEVKRANLNNEKLPNDPAPAIK